MNLPFFIANRLAFSKKSSISGTIIRIAIAAIGISITAMILAVFMIRGFQESISEKIFGFWGHIDISGMESTNEISLSPLVDFDPYIDEILNIDTISYYDDNDKEVDVKCKIEGVQKYIIYPAILLSKSGYEGIVAKGVGEDFFRNYLSGYLKKGNIPDFGSDKAKEEILISKYTADRLNLDNGKYLIINFFTDNQQIKKRLKISGIYSTGLMEYDKKLSFVDIDLIREAISWDKNEIGGVEVFIEDINNAELLNQYIYSEILPAEIYSMTIQRKFPSIFEWLKIQNLNEKVILVLMLIVSVINMITALLILILEQTNMIGILRALGMETSRIRSIFLYHAGFILLFGLLLGDFIGITISVLQKKYGFIKLDEANYYLSYAPIHFDFTALLLINLGTLLITIIILIIPSYIVSKIDPIKTISYR
ncbi:MAG: FtsX-like permease family protein [Saprospiraceae bacterium]